MNFIMFKIDNLEAKSIKEYTETNNISVSTLYRKAILEKIEDEISLRLYTQTMAEHKANP